MTTTSPSTTRPAWTAVKAATFGAELGVKVPADPENYFAACPGFDKDNPSTCWNDTTKQYACQANPASCRQPSPPATYPPSVPTPASGAPAYLGWLDQAHAPNGRLVGPLREDDPVVRDPSVNKLCALVVATEDSLLEHNKKGDFQTTIFRYPNIYGPRMLNPREWCVVRRVRDGRKFIILPFGGMTFHERTYAENAAYAFMLAVEKPSAAAGQVYNLAEERKYSLRQVVEVVLEVMGAKMEFLDLPWDWAEAGKPFIRHWHHKLLDSTKIRQQLGYTEIVPTPVAMRRTVEWYMKNPLKPGCEEEKTLQDAFDYAAEDRVYEICKETSVRLAEAYQSKFAWRHTYEHPKEVGEKRYQEGTAKGKGA